jgi:hypothetical protein
MKVLFQRIDFAPFSCDRAPARLVQKRLEHSVVLGAAFDLTILQAWLFGCSLSAEGGGHAR